MRMEITPMKRRNKQIGLVVTLIVAFLCMSYMSTLEVQASDSFIQLTLNSSEDSSVVPPLQILFLLTVMALLPAILVTTTSFTRIIIVLGFSRSALGVQQSPPNQVLIGLGLFLTLFIMSPTINTINETAIEPYKAGEINQEQVLERCGEPMRKFMFSQVGSKELALFADIAGVPVKNLKYEDGDLPTVEELPTRVLIPAFIISEIKTAFILGFIIYVPFIVIDMVVASTLMSMGMMMLPPVMISLPFKILLFILVDGWDLLIGNLVQTFR